MTAYFNWFISFACDFTCLLICVGQVSRMALSLLRLNLAQWINKSLTNQIAELWSVTF